MCSCSPKKDKNLAMLTHCGRATHIFVSKLTIIASDNGLSPGRHQAIIWNNAGILSIGLLGTKFIEILIKILTYYFKEMRMEVSSAKWRPFCLGLNVLTWSVLCLLITCWLKEPGYQLYYVLLRAPLYTTVCSLPNCCAEKLMLLWRDGYCKHLVTSP